MGDNGGFRVPGWFLASIMAVAAIVGVTVKLLQDRSEVIKRVERLERDHCVLVSYLVQKDPRMASFYRDGCP